MSGIVFCFVLAFFIPILFWLGVLSLFLLIVLSFIEIAQLFMVRAPIEVERQMSNRFSLSDDNEVVLNLLSHSKKIWHYELLDELPVQLQVRDFLIKGKIEAYGKIKHSYRIKPLSRGIYVFNFVNLFLIGPLQLIKRRIHFDLRTEVGVYPSIIQMKSAELFMASKIARIHGIKKMRRIGHSYEFEQIKQYTEGDDIRQINWKSSARHQQLMSNQFEDEKSQAIYMVIDKSRVMLMPFNGLSLLDYSINASLAMSNIALKKQDQVGLMCFSDKMGAVLKADRRQGQLRSILELLYKQNERDLESDFENLYLGIRNLIKTRSLLFLFTNFESMYALERVKPILKKLNSMHLLVLIFFENSHYDTLLKEDGNSIEWYYKQILIEQAINEKQAMVNELNMMGIQTVLSKPEDLNIQTINKYLEIKSRGLI